MNVLPQPVRLTYRYTDAAHDLSVVCHITSAADFITRKQGLLAYWCIESDSFAYKHKETV